MRLTLVAYPIVERRGADIHSRWARMSSNRKVTTLGNCFPLNATMRPKSRSCARIMRPSTAAFCTMASSLKRSKPCSTKGRSIILRSRGRNFTALRQTIPRVADDLPGSFGASRKVYTTPPFAQMIELPFLNEQRHILQHAKTPPSAVPSPYPVEISCCYGIGHVNCIPSGPGCIAQGSINIFLLQTSTALLKF